MILTDQMIEAAVSEGAVRIEPFLTDQIQPASYDLRIGPVAALASSHGKVDVREKGFLEMAPGDFAIVVSEETLTLDNRHTGRFSLRNKWAYRGLIANTDPQIGPGFTGRLSVGLTNLTDKSIALSHLDDFLQVEFHRLSESAKNRCSDGHSGQSALSNEELETVLGREVISLSEMHATMQTLTSNQTDLNESMGELEGSTRKLEESMARLEESTGSSIAKLEGSMARLKESTGSSIAKLEGSMEKMEYSMEKLEGSMEQLQDSTRKSIEEMKESTANSIKQLEKYMDRSFAHMHWLVGIGIAVIAIMIAITTLK